MRTVAITLAALVLVTAGCKKQEADMAHVGAPQVELKPMDSLKPVEQDVPAASATDILPELPLRAEGESTELSSEPERLSEIAQPSSAPPRTYTIQPKDTLWSIAKRHLGDGKRWKEIVDENPGLDPQKLRIGQTIRLPEQ